VSSYSWPSNCDFSAGTTGVKLCRDCEHRPVRFAQDVEAPACTLRPGMDAIGSREDCKAAGLVDWVRGR
jgi:hypothetical protein